MKKLFWLFLMIGLCNVGKAQDIAALKKDPDILIIKHAINQLKSHVYKIPPNFASLITKNESPEEMKAVLKKNGMVKADEFVNLITTQQQAAIRFNKNHPEITKLETAKRAEIINEALTD